MLRDGMKSGHRNAEPVGTPAAKGNESTRRGPLRAMFMRGEHKPGHCFSRIIIL